MEIDPHRHLWDFGARESYQDCRRPSDYGTVNRLDSIDSRVSQQVAKARYVLQEIGRFFLAPVAREANMPYMFGSLTTGAKYSLL